MKNENNYLNEFEQEFELDDELEQGNPSDYHAQEYDGEQEDGFESEGDDEYLMEADDEFETDDQEFEAWDAQGGYNRNREYENRLYETLNSGYDNEFEMEQEVNRVLHEMEQDYFFGSVGKWLKKRGGGILKTVAGNTPLGAAVKAISAPMRGRIRSLLKNKLFQTAASFIPGAGPIVSKAMDVVGNMDSETPAATSRNQVRQAVQVGQKAYQNLADDLTRARNPRQLQQAGKNAWNRAVRDHRSASATPPVAGRQQRNIRIRPGSHVVVYPTYIRIVEP